ncbi:MAG: radical SAM protein [Myxococcales bacterium]|nr:radical SAM protein [Myxococcales bacterium]
MGLKDVRRRLPIVDALPVADTRRLREPAKPGTVPTPRLAVWELTLACDLQCIHCGSRAGPRRPGELSTEECLDLVRQLRELGVGEVTVVGGEAYLRNDFILVIRAIRDAGMACTMTTGGRNLHRERAEAMVEAGVSSVNVSIDGMEQSHDHLRGVPGSWRAAFAAVANLQAAGAKVHVNTQINPRTMHDLPALLERLHEAGIPAWQLQITAPFGHAGDRPELLLQPYMMIEVFEILDGLVERATALGVRLWPANNLGYFGRLEAKLRKLQKRGAHYKGCVAGRYQLGIEADGAIKGCPSLGGPENIGGNVREHSLREIWERSEQLAYIRERSEAELWGYCAECYYASVCRAGCTATAEPLLGRPGNNPFCIHRAEQLRAQGQRERIELVVKGSGEPFDHGLYRLVREPIDPHARGRPGAISVEPPRISRTEERMGPGRPADVPQPA